jgi:membrane-bound lytic murein transglycosylase MltF
MTIGIQENLSLLRSVLPQELRRNDLENSAGKTDGVFAERLDRALGTASTEQVDPANAQNVAEALSLQMLHTSLNLAGDGSPETAPMQVFGQQQSSTQTLLKAYADAAAQSPKTKPAYDATQLPQEQLEVVVPASLAASATTGGKELDPIIAKASRRYGVDTGLIKAVIKAESNFNPNAVSHAGARGLMQLMPGTARSLGVNDSFDPEQNVMGGTRFLRDLLDRYNGDVDSALAAYNWGPGNVDRKPDRLPRETREYLVRVKQLYASYTG